MESRCGIRTGDYESRGRATARDLGPRTFLCLTNEAISSLFMLLAIDA